PRSCPTRRAGSTASWPPGSTRSRPAPARSSATSWASACWACRRARGDDAMTMDRRDVLKTMSLAAAGMLAGCASATTATTATQTGPVKFSAGTETPKSKAPGNATDCHHHIYNAKFPVDPTATLRPPDALVADYRALQKRIGTTRNVLVQPSTYGIDNRAHLEALAAFGPTARMVAVVDDTVSTDELKRMHALGVRGIRFNLATGGA